MALDERARAERPQVGAGGMGAPQGDGARGAGERPSRGAPLEESDHGPWERARFLAVRESLAHEWEPRNGIEWMLLDMLAQAYTGYE